MDSACQPWRPFCSVPTGQARGVESGWQKTSPGLEAVMKHAQSQGHVGVIPASLGCAVIDVDEGGLPAFQAVGEALGDPVTSTETRREGGFHMWYRDASAAGNRKWNLPAGGGDVSAVQKVT